MKYLLLLCLTMAFFCADAQTQQRVQPSNLPGFTASPDELPMRLHHLRLSQASYLQKTAHKTTTPGAGVFDTTRWAFLVDSTWSSGMADTDKMSVFNTYWAQMDSLYACFINLPAYNWDSIVAATDTEIIHGVSEGRFAAICNNFMTMINDGHSDLSIASVNYPPMIYAGLPVFRGESGLFGASITTLNDTEAMVYAAHADHPFHLQPGDVIAGYNNVPWLSLVKTILRHQLPNSVYKGSTDAATWHRYMQAAGENWYLFDTINIRKCDGSMVNLPTSLMNGVLYQDFPTEQMPVPGVNIVTYNQYYYSGVSLSWGVITGTRIGYVYMYDCSDASGNNMLNAVKTLVEDSMVNGLIIDIRTNFGGGFNAYIKTFEYLNNEPVSWVGYGDRYDMNRMHLYNYGFPSWYDVNDDDPHYFNHKVAILCGPNAVSAGDFLPVLFKHNPNVKVFGKSTAGAYGSSVPVTMPFVGIYARRQAVNFFKVGAPTSYITHTEVPVDSAIWFKQDSVCAGRDNMVSTAVQWIEGYTIGINDPSGDNISVNVFPNPVNDRINLAFYATTDEQYTIKLNNLLGANLLTTHCTINAGSPATSIDIHALNLASGNYYLVFENRKGARKVQKITIVR